MKKPISFIFFIFFILNISCVKENIEEVFVQNVDTNAKSPSGEIYMPQNTMIILGEKVPNPYALSVMQNAYEEMVKSDSHFPILKKLNPTDLYVRFLPKDSTDLRILDESGLILFDYPLDYEIDTMGNYYHDPTIPDDMPTWLYTTVPVGYSFPDIEYEILEECFIPDDTTDSLLPLSISAENMERKAYEICGIEEQLIVSDNDKSRLAKYTPQGFFEVKDSDGNIFPIEGMRIVTHNIVRIASTYTNEDGYYKMPKAFWTKVWYSMVFKNERGFSIYNNYNVFTPATSNLGRGHNYGIDRMILPGYDSWTWSVINNAVCDYLDISKEKGIACPQDLKILEIDFLKDSSAPMLSHGIYLITIAYNAITSFLLIVLGMPLVFVQLLLSAFLPDITIGTLDKQNNSEMIYKTVFHELSHASHMNQATGSYWGKYISHIVTYNGYGDGSGLYSGVCEVGEMWGYAMGEIHYKKNYLGQSLEGEYPENNVFWFKPQIYWDLIRDGLIDETRLFSYMTEDVDNLSKLKEKIYVNTTHDKLEIAKVFEKYNKSDGKIQWQIVNRTDEDLQLYVNSRQFPIGDKNGGVSFPDIPPIKDTVEATINPGDIGVAVGGQQIDNGYIEESFKINEKYTIAEFPDLYLNCSELVDYESICPSTIIIFDKIGETLKEIEYGDDLCHNFFSDALWEKSFPGDSLIIYTLNITDEFLTLD